MSFCNKCKEIIFSEIFLHMYMYIIKIFEVIIWLKILFYSFACRKNTSNFPATSVGHSKMGSSSRSVENSIISKPSREGKAQNFLLYMARRGTTENEDSIHRQAGIIQHNMFKMQFLPAISPHLCMCFPLLFFSMPFCVKCGYFGFSVPRL